MKTEMQEPICEETLPVLSDAAAAVEESAVFVPGETVADSVDCVPHDFAMLAEAFPQFTDVSQLPFGVLDTAEEQGITLLDAYLRYRLQEEKKVAAAGAKQREAATRSAGSLSRGAVQTPPEQDAFLRAFRAAL